MVLVLNETELRVLAAFFPDGTERTTREIEERSTYSHERAYSALKSLEGKGVLSKRKVGKTLVYSVSKFDDAAYLAFARYSIGKKSGFIKKHPAEGRAIEEFTGKAKPYLAILFGSYSKGEAGKKSDLDVLCVSGSKETEKIALSLRHKHNLKITPVIVKKEDFKNIKTENPALWNDITCFGIIFRGQEMFYELVYGELNEKRN